MVKGLTKTGKKMVIRAAALIRKARKMKKKAMKMKIKKAVKRKIRRKRR